MTTNTKTVDITKGRVDRRIFGDQDIYQQELEQIFGRCWLFVGHESQIPKPNDFAANYMGEDPILVTRDAKGKLHAFLNMCRHRGNRICRADAGNAPSFMCTYHGWTFSTDGKLVGVPGYKEAYFEELDRSQWGLVEAKVDTYKGLIFATWDANAPTLRDYLGEAPYYLDLVVDRREGGTEVVGGVHRWIMEANWKFGVDNFGGDHYHVPVTHGSAMHSGVMRSQSQAAKVSAPPVMNGDPDRACVYAGNGHCVLGGYAGSGQTTGMLSHNPLLQKYFEENLAELGQRLGEQRRRQAGFGIGSLFPNFSWHFSPFIRSWHPRSATKTEMWTYCLVDKAAPQEVKDLLRKQYTLLFGPAGNQEVDDMNNWLQCTDSALYQQGRKFPINIQMGLGKERRSEIIPGVLSPTISEGNWRGFYDWWGKIMAAPSWKDLDITKPSRELSIYIIA